MLLTSYYSGKIMTNLNWNQIFRCNKHIQPFWFKWIWDIFLQQPLSKEPILNKWSLSKVEHSNIFDGLYPSAENINIIEDNSKVAKLPAHPNLHILSSLTLIQLLSTSRGYSNWYYQPLHLNPAGWEFNDYFVIQKLYQCSSQVTSLTPKERLNPP